MNKKKIFFDLYTINIDQFRDKLVCIGFVPDVGFLLGVGFLPGIEDIIQINLITPKWFKEHYHLDQDLDVIEIDMFRVRLYNLKAIDPIVEKMYSIVSSISHRDAADCRVPENGKFILYGATFYVYIESYNKS